MTDDTEDVCKYGTPLEPLDEDELPRKKPVTIEEQYALDDSGRRRFHGAFTGGFSAGFCNTVGSLEGWTPSTFKSSRATKAESRLQKPEDFMDTEDREEWGIAPKRLQATSDYSDATSVKRKRFIGPSGAIPGDPVLHSLMAPASSSVGVRLLRQMGWRDGQGTGPRKNASARQQHQHQEDIEKENSDGLVLPSGLTFAPCDAESLSYQPKLDTFGMGYSGLDRNTFRKPFTLFEQPPATLNIVDRNKKKLSVSGQAFGVGAFEDEDDDIYHREDMTQYDFSLEDQKKNTPLKKTANRTRPNPAMKSIEGFESAHCGPAKFKQYPLPAVPPNYEPTCGRKTRFGPPVPASRNKLATNEKTGQTHAREDGFDNHLKRGLGRHDLDPAKRREIVTGEVVSRVCLVPDVDDQNNDKCGSGSNAKEEEEKKRLLEQASSITRLLLGPTSAVGSVFRPFAADPDKQRRYDLYVTFERAERERRLRHLQPLNMTEWERDRECREFEQACRLYKPLEGVMSDRFVSSGAQDQTVDRQSSQLKTEEEAARNKMYGRMTRRVEPWRPISLMCKRFNVPEPLGGCAPMDEADKKSSNFSIFDYVEGSVHNRKNFKNSNNASINNTTREEGGASEESERPVDDGQTSSDIAPGGSVQKQIKKLHLPEPKHDKPIESKIVDKTDGVAIEDKMDDIHVVRNSTREIGEAKDDKSVTNVDQNKKVSEFEKKIEASLSTSLPENKSLFKLIFADSSDSETEDNSEVADSSKEADQNDKTKNSMDEMKSYLLSNENVNPKITAVTTVKTELEDKKPENTVVIGPDRPASGIFANIDLDALKTGERKFVFQAPAKNKSQGGGLNTFTTANLAAYKSNNMNPVKIAATVEESKAETKKIADAAPVAADVSKQDGVKNMMDDAADADVSSSSGVKIKKSKKKHKVKEKRKKKKEKKSKKSKSKKEKRRSP